MKPSKELALLVSSSVPDPVLVNVPVEVITPAKVVELLSLPTREQTRDRQ